ncbi:TPA: hypothetical protein NKZ32_003510 [Vibrio parahaemolyticus]|uniref:hypothetical protein n=1 Tax=Vibrio sp. Y184 TaxID=3074705 RepID=UPI0029669B4F|nr:hypothetical protein [Vibrio sp. Y184]MDW3169751.1 hypothetical protein [Vibrio sp. Y184]HCH5484513.1 hypothetical protein [Vibrio parahaemolyticus]
MKTNILGLYETSDGKVYEVVEYIEQIPFRDLKSGQYTYRDGEKDYKTTCGVDINKVGENFMTLSNDPLTKL